MQRHRLDDFVEQRLGKRGVENVALAVLASGCIAGIVLLSRVG